MKRRRIIAALAAIAAVICLSSCSGKGPAKSAVPGGPGSPAGASGTSEAKAVRIQAAEIKTLRPYLDQSGTHFSAFSVQNTGTTDAAPLCTSG